MGKRLLFFAIIFLSLLAFTLWRAQPPFRLQRKLLAKLPYMLYLTLLITDLDDDGHPEVMAVKEDEPLIWVRFPFDKPSLLRFENYRAIWVQGGCFVLKALPVLTMDDRLRLLRWKEGKAKLDPLPSLPDVPMDDILVGEGKGTGTVFLRVDQGNNCWLFTLTPQGEWQFASWFKNQAIRFRNFAMWHIADLADLDRDGILDALCVQWQPIEDAWVFWGGRKEGETNLGAWIRYGYPQIADLDGDGWMEIVMVEEHGHLQVWGFDQRQRRLRVIATSPPLPLPVDWSSFNLHLSDLDKGDGRKEILVSDFSGNFWVFQWREGRLKMWQSKTGFRGWVFKQVVKFDDQLALTYTHHRPVWLFPPRIWMEDWKLRWRFKEWVQFTVFCLLPKDEQTFSPPHWHFQKAPFELWFAGDIDGDGSDELIGRDFSWRCWRLYRAEVTKAGELRWRDVLLGREKPEPTAFALLVDGKRRGLVIAWEDGRLELLTMEGRR